MNVKTLFLIATIAVFVPGCAHQIGKYEGQKPDLSLSGPDAQREIRRFELENDNNICRLPCFKHDPKKRQHAWESVQPLLEFVSPQAIQEYQRSKTWSDVQLYALGVGVTGLLVGLATNGSERTTSFAFSLAGSVISIVSSSYVGSIRSNIPEIYNRELKEKFTPSVGMIWPLQ